MLDILPEAGMLGCKATDTLIDPNLKLLPNQGGALERSRCRRLVGKINYLQ